MKFLQNCLATSLQEDYFLAKHSTGDPMKKLMVITLAILATTAFAGETRNCESEKTQNLLRCQKIQQICFRYPAETPAFEFCMDDSYTCVEETKTAFEACLEAAKK